MRLFIDMDGTLARFHDEVQYLERMFEKDFFKNLKPFENAVSAVNELIKTCPEIEVYILSAAVGGEPPYCEFEKHLWIANNLGGIDTAHMLFTAMGENKASAIPGGIKGTDILWDDYNKNLEEWEKAGGVAVKCKNNINHKGLVGELWQGFLIDNQNRPQLIYNDLCGVIATVNEQENSYAIGDE